MTDTNIDPVRHGAAGNPENFGRAVPAALAAAIVGAGLWALVVYVTSMKLGLVVIAIGVLIGYAVRTAGHGRSQQFAILGGASAAFSWALGTVLCDVAFVAKDAGIPFVDALGRLGLSGGFSLALRAADGMDLLFLAIAVWEGYKFSRLRGPAMVRAARP